MFAVVTGSDAWEIDDVSEWFPAIANRRSAGTVQGHEWLGNAAWQRQQDAYASLQDCAVDVLPCVLEWAERYELAGDPRLPPERPIARTHELRRIAAPRRATASSWLPGSRVVYDGPGATVIELP